MRENINKAIIINIIIIIKVMIQSIINNVLIIWNNVIKKKIM